MSGNNGQFDDEKEIRQELDEFMKTLDFDQFKKSRKKIKRRSKENDIDQSLLELKNKTENSEKSKRKKKHLNDDVGSCNETHRSDRIKAVKDDKKLGGEKNKISHVEKQPDGNVLESSRPKKIKRQEVAESDRCKDKDISISSLTSKSSTGKPSKPEKTDRENCQKMCDVASKEEGVPEKTKAGTPVAIQNKRSGQVEGGSSFSKRVKYGFNLQMLSRALVGSSSFAPRDKMPGQGQYTISEKSKKRKNVTCTSSEEQPKKKRTAVKPLRPEGNESNSQPDVESVVSNRSSGITDLKKKKKAKWRECESKSSEKTVEDKKSNILSDVKRKKDSSRSNKRALEDKHSEKCTEDQKPQKSELDLWTEQLNSQVRSAAFRLVNEELYTNEAPSAAQLFKRDPESFKLYHEGYTAQVARWPVDPLKLIQRWIVKKPRTWVIADFGCGDARLSRMVPNKKVHNLDLYSANSRVTQCDMAHTPIDTGTVDVVVFCLSLMGTDVSPYIAEANRVLRTGGFLKIAEVESRFNSAPEFIRGIERLGFKSAFSDTKRKYFWLFDFIKQKDSNSTSTKSILLKPCTYKKR